MRFKKFFTEKEIIPNIKQNPRNGQNENIYFDEELYKNRFKIERSFAWLDSFKGLIIRYENLNTTDSYVIFRVYTNIYSESLNKFYNDLSKT